MDKSRTDKANPVFAHTVIVLLLTGVFWLLRDFAPEGGDTRLFLSNHPSNLLDNKQLLYHYREPACIWIWQIIHYLLGGFRDRRDIELRIVAFQIMSVLSGAVFWWFLLDSTRFLGAIGKSWFRKAIFVLPCFFSSATLIFCGLLEVYGPLFAVFMLWWWALARHLNNPRRYPYWQVILAWVACTFVHRISVLYTIVLFAVYPFRKGKYGLPLPDWDYWTGVFFVCCIIFIVFSHSLFILSYMHSAYFIPVVIESDFLELLTPWTTAWRDHVTETSQTGARHLFIFGSLEHWKHLGYFALLAAPLGIPICLVLWRKIRGPKARFLLVWAILGWTWTLLWHPHQGYRDWDLFSNPGVPTNLLAGLLLVRTFFGIHDRTVDQEGEKAA